MEEGEWGPVTAYLGLGSNLGDREDQLLQALSLLAGVEGIEVEGRSSWYETSPVGKMDQEWYLNGVVRIRTTLSPRALLDAVLGIEERMGRVRRERWGPRNIDIDILIYDGLIVDEPDLKIPHPRLLERAFTLIPLAEIAPELVLPNGRRAAEAARGPFDGQQVVLPYREARC
ncbi:MAG: 2-amino-4-hydroxy-6-hydroxymethyldihydropteridine diphosphokinase [Moorella sp. (in: firmicutes)]